MKDLQKDTYEFPLAKLQIINWVLLIFMTLASWSIITPYFAKGVLVGGILANTSFIFLKKDLVRILAGPLHSAKARFFLKYYVRLAVLALILFMLVRYQIVHVVGLVTGLSTVVLSIGFVTASLVKRFFFAAKEAS